MNKRRIAFVLAVVLVVTGIGTHYFITKENNENISVSVSSSGEDSGDVLVPENAKVENDYLEKGVEVTAFSDGADDFWAIDPGIVATVTEEDYLGSTVSADYAVSSLNPDLDDNSFDPNNMTDEEYEEYLEETLSEGNNMGYVMPRHTFVPEIAGNASSVKNNGASVYAGTDIDQAFYDGSVSDNESSYISPVARLPKTRNQINTQCCWAFGSMAMAETSLISKGITTNEIDLSELQLSYFTYNTVTDPLGGTEGDVNSISQAYRNKGYNFLNMGGNYIFSQNILAGWVGAVNESDVPFDDRTKALSSGIDSDMAYNNDKAHLTDYFEININDRDAIKACIKEYGAVGEAYRAPLTNSALESYYERAYASFYCDVYSTTNHAITLVGWDDNFSKDKFKIKPANDGAWLVRNSYSAGYETDYKNYNTYFWISYEDKTLNSTAYAFVFDDASKLDNNYQYDGGMYSSSIYGVPKYANVFTACANDKKGGAERLKAVSFYTPSTDVNFTVEIYRDITDKSDISTGTLVESATVSGVTSLAGYRTVELPHEIILKKGENFAVAVSLRDNKGAYASVKLGTDYDDGDKSWYDIDVVSNQNESFYYNGVKWIDWGKGSNRNLRIKAFTTNSDDGTWVSIIPNKTYYVTKDQVTYTLEPSTVSDNYTVSSDDASIVSVSDNVATAMHPGTTKLKVSYTKNGETATSEASVSIYPRHQKSLCSVSSNNVVTLSWNHVEEATFYRVLTGPSPNLSQCNQIIADRIYPTNLSEGDEIYFTDERFKNQLEGGNVYYRIQSVTVVGSKLYSISGLPTTAVLHDIPVLESKLVVSNMDSVSPEFTITGDHDSDIPVWHSSDPSVVLVETNGQNPVLRANKVGYSDVTVEVDGVSSNSMRIVVKPRCVSVNSVDNDAEHTNVMTTDFTDNDIADYYEVYSGVTPSTTTLVGTISGNSVYGMHYNFTDNTYRNFRYKKLYYVRIKSYITIDGQKYCSDYSSPESSQMYANSEVLNVNTIPRDELKLNHVRTYRIDNINTDNNGIKWEYNSLGGKCTLRENGLECTIRGSVPGEGILVGKVGGVIVFNKLIDVVR